MENLNKEQKDVLLEFIREVKNESSIITLNDCSKRIDYDFKYGKGETIELLNKHFYKLIERENLSNEQLSIIARRVYSRENKWILVKNTRKIDMDKIDYDGYGYVIMSDGTRIDCEPDIYKEERDEYNNIRDVRLKQMKTNGIEYIIH